jgi:hypothetical protein
MNTLQIISLMVFTLIIVNEPAPTKINVTHPNFAKRSFKICDDD